MEGGAREEPRQAGSRGRGRAVGPAEVAAAGVAPLLREAVGMTGGTAAGAAAGVALLLRVEGGSDGAVGMAGGDAAAASAGVAPLQ
jgi:hypothetical protein